MQEVRKSKLSQKKEKIHTEYTTEFQVTVLSTKAPFTYVILVLTKQNRTVQTSWSQDISCLLFSEIYRWVRKQISQHRNQHTCQVIRDKFQTVQELCELWQKETCQTRQSFFLPRRRGLSSVWPRHKQRKRQGLQAVAKRSRPVGIGGVWRPMQGSQTEWICGTNKPVDVKHEEGRPTSFSLQPSSTSTLCFTIRAPPLSIAHPLFIHRSLTPSLSLIPLYPHFTPSRQSSLARLHKADGPWGDMPPPHTHSQSPRNEKQTLGSKQTKSVGGTRGQVHCAVNPGLARRRLFIDR